ncbi:MAG TPA: alginate export family protein [Phycisphaerae bacterium]|nr:alginate export family protein [Phycisphaerae bacterium]
MTTRTPSATVCRAALLFTVIAHVAFADEPTDQPPPPSAKPAPTNVAKSKSPATNRVSDRPGYAKSFDRFTEDGDMSWLDFGIEQRTRFELRHEFFGNDGESDERFMLRSRAYLGVREVLDPLRFGFEFQDSRAYGSRDDETTADVNQTELLQAFGELYFKDALGADQPLSFRVGRMSFDAVDRRLFARNRFRNTTNAFDGFRIRMGDDQSPWELDVFAFQPVERRQRHFDHGDDERWIYGINGYWRGWSPYLTLEPYYFILDEDRKGYDRVDREIHTLGLHGFGLIGETGFDYDFNVAFQFGETEFANHRAFAMHGEIGYSWPHPWKPRAAFMIDYASGDDDPDDAEDKRFDRLFGAAHTFYGYSDIFRWQNTINPAVYISVRPTKRLHLEGYYRTYWLASDTDAWVGPGISDSTGWSGDFVGQEIDLRARYKLCDNANLDLGYAYFMPADFVQNATDTTDDSDFFYVQMVWTF